MADPGKKFIFEDGVCFEVTPYGLICCLKESKDKSIAAQTANSANGVLIRDAVSA